MYILLPAIAYIWIVIVPEVYENDYRGIWRGRQLAPLCHRTQLPYVRLKGDFCDIFKFKICQVKEEVDDKSSKGPSEKDQATNSRSVKSTSISAINS